MRTTGWLLITAAIFAVAVPARASAMPAMTAEVLGTSARASAQVQRIQFYDHYAPPYGYYYVPYVYDYYRPYSYYGYVVPSYSYYDYYQTYGCYAPDSYCVYYNW